MPMLRGAPAKAILVGPLLRQLDARKIPHRMFINKIETLEGRVQATLEALQAFSQVPLALRQVPIREGGPVTGYVDVVSERAYRYRKGQPSEVIAVPAAVRAREVEVRGLLEDWFVRQARTGPVRPAHPPLSATDNPITRPLALPPAVLSDSMRAGMFSAVKTRTSHRPAIAAMREAPNAARRESG